MSSMVFRKCYINGSSNLLEELKMICIVSEKSQLHIMKLMLVI